MSIITSKTIEELGTLAPDKRDPVKVAQTYKQLVNQLAGLNSNNASDMLPLMFRLKDQPFSLKDHFPMEPMYALKDIPPHITLMCGRQVSKSTTLAAQGILRSLLMANRNTIYVTPLFEQVRRFSNNVVRPLINFSPIKTLCTGASVSPKDNSVFQRTFVNNSSMFFTFAFLDAERNRGIPGDILNLDEAQDIDHDFLPILESCLDASDIQLIQLSGTPKTTDTTLHYGWQDSSQAHWITKCEHCNDWNIAALDFGLDKMVQPNGFSCKKCGQLLNPRNGQYHHMFRDRAYLSPGYHVPQTIMPMHYGVPNKWAKLYSRKLKWPQNRYFNEILGEACDQGSKLVTAQQLRSCASLEWENKIEEALKHRSEYLRVAMGVDWGSGAAGQIQRKRNQIIVVNGTASFTHVTITGGGHDPSKADVLYTERLPANMKPEDEIKYVLGLLHRFDCHILAHDFTGAGFLREAMVVQAGLPASRMMPCQYTYAPSSPIINYSPETDARPRHYYSVDKSRSLTLLCRIINAGLIRLPKWDDASSQIYLDFLALIEERTENARSSGVYLIHRNPKQTDDFCHSLNFSTLALWHTSQVYPNLADQFGVSLTGQESLEWDGGSDES